MAFKSCNHPIPIYTSSFLSRLLCILIRLVKLQYTFIKTSHNLNNVMHAHDSLFVHCEAYPLFHYYEPYALFHYYEPYALFVIMSLTLSSLLWALRSLPLLWALRSLPLLCVHALCFTIQTLYSYSLQIMPYSNTMNQTTWNLIILLCIIKSQLQHTFKYINQFKTFHSYIIS